MSRNRFTPPLAAKLERQVLPSAAERTTAGLRRELRRAVLELDPRGADEQHTDAATERRVCLEPDEHAMAWLHAYLPAADAQTIWTAMQAIADGTPADGRTADQKRADALTSLAADALFAGDVGERHGRKPTIQVSVALSTLLGLDEQSAELDGYGPIPAGLARRLAADPTGTWARLVTDEIGRLIDYGRTRYAPPQDLTDHVIARDRICRHPGCHRLARQADIDHITAWVDGGETNAANLHPLCPRHHAGKHEAGWSVRRTPDGSTEWTSPTGRRYTREPDGYPIDRSTAAAAGADPPPF